MRTINNRMRDHDETIIYDALKECAPAYVAQGEAMALYAMELCGLDDNTIRNIHEEFLRITTRRELMGKKLRCIDLTEHLQSKYGIDTDNVDVNFPDYKAFVKEWRK